MLSLGVQPPIVITRVSEYIDQIIAHIQVLVAKGMAYACNGWVHFSKGAFEKKGINLAS